MEQVLRHQCLVYDGAPSKQLPALAKAIRSKLAENYRCLYFNTAPMVAGMRSYLAAEGLDVTAATHKKSLVTVSEQSHLDGESFCVDRMIRGLETALKGALADGYAGLWASGDMTWEFGPDKDYTKLLEYEWRLEQFFSEHPELCGVCQYHTDTLPIEAVREGVLGHRGMFLNQTLSVVNPLFVTPERFTDAAGKNPQLQAFIDQCVAAQQCA